MNLFWCQLSLAYLSVIGCIIWVALDMVQDVKIIYPCIIVAVVNYLL